MRFTLLAAISCLWLYGQTTPTPRTADAPPPTVNPEDKCSIEGTVVSSTGGEPLKKTHLTLRPVGGQGQQSGPPYGTMSDNAGHFLLNDLDPGSYVLGATRNGFVAQAYSPEGGIRQNSRITLTKGQKMTDLVFKLTPQGVITGHVLDADGEPLARVQLQVMTYTYQRGKKQLTQAGGGASTNDLGEYRVFGLKPGKYFLSARYQSPDMQMAVPERAVGSAQAAQAVEEGYATVYYPNALRADGASQIAVAPASQIHGVDITMARIRTVHIRGHINASISAVRRRAIALMLMPRDSGAFMFMPGNVARILDAKGNFDMRNVAPGSYYLFGEYAEENQRFVARIPIDVGNSNLDGIEVNFVPPGEIKGRVVVEDNGDLKGATLNVNLQSRVDQPRMGGTGAQTKDDLTFTLPNITPDSYEISVFGLPQDFYLKSIRMGDQDVTETGVDFSSGVPAGEMTIVVNPNGGKVEGTVKNAKGENAVTATVTLIPDASHRSMPWLYKTINTDQSGHFTLSGIRPGEYKIYAWDDIEYGAYQDPEFMKPYESAGQEVSIKESGHETVQLKIISRTD